MLEYIGAFGVFIFAIVSLISGAAALRYGHDKEKMGRGLILAILNIGLSVWWGLWIFTNKSMPGDAILCIGAAIIAAAEFVKAFDEADKQNGIALIYAFSGLAMAILLAASFAAIPF